MLFYAESMSSSITNQQRLAKIVNFYIVIRFTRPLQQSTIHTNTHLHTAVYLAVLVIRKIINGNRTM